MEALKAGASKRATEVQQVLERVKLEDKENQPRLQSMQESTGICEQKMKQYEMQERHYRKQLSASGYRPEVTQSLLHPAR